jgi:hypothetical protein
MAQRPDSFKGVDLTSPQNRIPAGKVAIAQNVRAYTEGGFALRTGLGDPIITVDSSINSLCRMNDTTPTGPEDGFCYIIVTDQGSVFVYPNVDSGPIAVGLSGDPVSQIPFRPNASVKPWDYIADSSMGVVLHTEFALDGSPATFDCFGQIKVRSDGLVYKTGIREPALAPTVSTENSSVVDSGPLLATAIPWTNFAGQNPNYDFGEVNGEPSPTPDGTAPFIVNVANASTIIIIGLSGVADINGNPAATPATLGPSTAASTNPGHSIQIAGSGGTPATATVVVGAFTDGAGNVVPAGVSPLWVPSVVDVGAAFAGAQTIQVPFGAQDFQIGINSTGDTFSANSGEFEIEVQVTTDALPPYMGVLGSLSLFYWGDSPTSGGVASYLWKNPGDPGGGIPRSTSNAVGATTGNSFIFDATFTAGLPGLPGTGTEDIPMQWFALSPESAVIGSAPVFPSPITATYPSNKSYNNFNFCLYGKIYIPAPGQYTFVVTSHDDFIWGIQDAALISAVASGSGEGGTIGLSNAGQTITVAQGYPLLPRQNYTDGEGGHYSQTTVVVAFAAAGVYGIEADYDYWFHSGRIFLIEASPTPGAAPTIISPLTQAVRTNVSYAGKYRSSLTGAQSNPSPTTTPTTTPVLASTVALPYSPDPQVDKCDYYRQDQGLPNFTFVGTGPNTNPPTGIVDALTDLKAANNQQMTYTDYEPVPSIDLPQAGHCNVSGGVITTLDTPFNQRWLPGTIILIGYPTQLAYEFISRPISNFQVVIPGVPDGTDLVWNIAEPVLANQPLSYMFGPTDNINYVLAVGDKLRPGTIYWCGGSNIDSWPQTNQADLTDPSEALVNGAMAAGYAVVFTIKRGFVYTANFFNALATVTGTSGSTWTQQATSISRGLFIPRCVAVEGGGNIFFRVDDGIHWSRRGASSVSITDEELYPLFVHEGSTPQPVERNGKTYYPPDDSQPEAQQFSIQNGYLYYDYGYAFGGDVVTDIAFVPDSGATVGAGIAWQNPGKATGVGSPAVAVITGWSVSGNIYTFYAENDFTAEELVTIAGLSAGQAPSANNLTFPVMPTGLSSTQFQISLPAFDAGVTVDSGTATPALPNYASVTVPFPPFSPDDGEYVAYSLPGTALAPETAFALFGGTPVAAAAASWIAGGAIGASGGNPFLAGVNCGWSNFALPTLPAGAVITRIYPVIQAANVVTNPGARMILSAGVGVLQVWTDITITANGQYTAPAYEDSLGTSTADITGAYVNLNLESSVPIWYEVNADLTSVVLAVYYTLPSGGTPSANQAQTLELSGTDLTFPADTVITGVEVDLASGLAFGSASVVTAQLTVDGAPVGISKVFNPDAWPSVVPPLGGDGDLWGQGGMDGTQANELGVNFSGSLNPGSQLNLNDVSITVFYETAAHEEGSATLVYDIRAKGWVFDQYDGPKPTVHAPNEGESQQGTLVGCLDGSLRLMESDAPEIVTGIVLTPAVGGVGWMTAYEATFEYAADSGALVSFIAADAGNGSYAPGPIILPGTGGEITKFTTKLTPSKWKLLQVQFEFTDPTLQVYLEGCVLEVKPWGDEGTYKPISIFRPSGGKGAQT